MADRRLRYYNGQLLDQEDFRAEQSYHLDRLRRHTRLLHTPGIAEGLTVDAPIGAAEATVEPGTALDAAGRQMVLAAPRAVPLAGHAGDTVLVVISFAEEAADPSGLGDGTETRWLEEPAVEAVSEGSAPGPDTHVRLARLTVAGDGTVAAAPELDVRVAAGAVASGVAAFDAHVGDTANPHGVTAAQTGALASIDGVSNPGGNVELVTSGAITLAPDDTQNRITIGENHSTRTDNPHNVTAAQIGALLASDYDLAQRAFAYVGFGNGNVDGATQTVNVGFQPKFVWACGGVYAYMYGGYQGAPTSGFVDLRGTINHRTQMLYVYRLTGIPYVYSYTSNDASYFVRAYFWDYNYSPNGYESIGIRVSSVDATGFTVTFSRAGNSSYTALTFAIKAYLACFG